MNAILIAAVLAAGAPVRDPFWPVGYEGVRRVISATPRIVPKDEVQAVDENVPPGADEQDPSAVATAEVSDPGEAWARRAEEARQKLEMDKRWGAAVRQLKFGGVVRMHEGLSAVLINGRARAEGDLVRLDHGGHRFVWRVVRSDAERKLRLERVNATGLDEIKGKRK